MKLIDLDKSKLTVAELAKLAKAGPVILTKKGEPLASIRDFSGSDWESVSMANNTRFQKLIEASRRAYREQGGTTLEELRAELGLAPGKRPRRKKNLK